MGAVMREIESDDGLNVVCGCLRDDSLKLMGAVARDDGLNCLWVVGWGDVVKFIGVVLGNKLLYMKGFLC